MNKDCPKNYNQFIPSMQQQQLTQCNVNQIQMFLIQYDQQSSSNCQSFQNLKKCLTQSSMSSSQYDSQSFDKNQQKQDKTLFIQTSQKSYQIQQQNNVQHKFQSQHSVKVTKNFCKSQTNLKVQPITKKISTSNVLIPKTTILKSSKNVLKPILHRQKKQSHPFKLETLIKQDFFSEQELSRLTNIQIQSIMHMQAISQSKNRSVQNTTQFRSRKLGNTPKDLEILRLYIQQSAPIIIHVHLSKYMEFFVKDTHYRNQFETKKSSGKLCLDSRTKWQNRLFDNHYADATDNERVKYGVINLTNDPRGVLFCTHYGLSYMKLKKNVRNRCTITDLDSSSGNCQIGTLKYCNQILNKMSDEQLRIMFKVSKNKRQKSMNMNHFRQIQIHGPIQFNKDIEQIHINKKQITNQKQLQKIQQFCQTNNILYKYF